LSASSTRADALEPEQVFEKTSPSVVSVQAAGWYTQRVQDKIQRLINYPSGAAAETKAEFELTIMASGWLVSAQLVTPSGDTQFDATALEAIWAADPLHDAREIVPFDGIRLIRIALRAVLPNPGAQTPLPTPPKPNRGDEAAALRHFTQEVWRILGKVVSDRDYPRLARDRGWEGLTKVRIEIGSDGLLKTVTTTQSSGYALLDDRAVSKIQEIKLPNIPEELRDRAFSVDIPFRFQLRRQAEEKGGIVLPGPSLQ
jgi:protein TonB